MAVYKITMLVNVEEGHPRKWIVEAVEQNLDADAGDEFLEYSIEKVDDEEQLTK